MATGIMLRPPCAMPGMCWPEWNIGTASEVLWSGVSHMASCLGRPNSGQRKIDPSASYPKACCCDAVGKSTAGAGHHSHSGMTKSPLEMLESTAGEHVHTS